MNPKWLDEARGSFEPSEGLTVNPYHGLVKALMLAVNAPDQERSNKALELAYQLIDAFDISELDIRRAQKEVEEALKCD